MPGFRCRRLVGRYGMARDMVDRVPRRVLVLLGLKDQRYRRDLMQSGGKSAGEHAGKQRRQKYCAGETASFG
jgi:hypothetical protein